LIFSTTSESGERRQDLKKNLWKKKTHLHTKEGGGSKEKSWEKGKVIRGDTWRGSLTGEGGKGASEHGTEKNRSTTYLLPGRKIRKGRLCGVKSP